MRIWNRLFKYHSKNETVDDLVREQMCRTFISLTSNTEKEQFLRDHPEMLDPFTEAFLLEVAEKQRDAYAAASMRNTAALLRRCRQSSISDEFTNKSQPGSILPDEERLISVIHEFLNSPTLQARRQIIEKHTELLTDKADSLMQRVSDDRVRKAIEPWRLLLLRCREIGIPEAMEEMEKIQIKENPNARIVEMLEPLLRAKSVDQILTYIRSHPDIVNQKTINFLTAFIQQADSESRPYFTHIRDLLIRIRSKGLQQVSSELSKKSHNISHGNQTTRKSGRSFDDLIALDKSLDANPSVAPILIEDCEALLKSDSGEFTSEHKMALWFLLGRAYVALEAGDHNANLWAASVAYRNALSLLDENADKGQVAKLHLILASIFSQIVSGNSEPKFILATTHYAKAIEFLDPDHESYVTAHLNLGCLLMESGHAESEIHVEQAIKHFNEVLRCEWIHLTSSIQIKLHLNFGAAYIKRIKGNRKTNLDLAIKHLKHALALVEEDDPKSRAEVSFNLARAILARNEAGQLSKASALFHSALEYYDHTSDKGVCAVIFASIGYLLQSNPALASKTGFDADYYAHRARRLLPNLSDIDALQMVCISLADFYARTNRWSDVSDVLTLLLDQAESEFDDREILRDKRNSAVRYTYAYTLKSYALARQGYTEQSLGLLFRGKARVWRDALNLRAQQPSTVPENTWRSYVDAAYSIRAEQWEQSHLYDPHHYLISRKKRKDALDKAVKQVRDFEPDFLRSASVKELRKHLAVGTCFVTVAVTDFGSIAFIITPDHQGTILSVEIPTFTRDKLRRLLFDESDKEGKPSGGWLGTYLSRVRDALLTMPSDWFETVDAILAELGRELILPIVTQIPTSVEKLIVMPTGLLTLLPWHASVLDTQTDQRLYDRYIVTYTASPDLYLRTSDPLLSEADDSAAFIINLEDDSLPFVKAENTLLQERFHSVDSTPAELATRKGLLKVAKSASIVHIACHGEFCWHDVGRSHLRLSDGLITLDELLVGDLLLETIGQSEAFITAPVDFSNIRLATLSACETGIVDAVRDSGNEYMSLSAAFIVCGAKSVVASLWIVDDLSTTLLMNDFYTRLAAGTRVSEALRAAACWLRKVTAAEIRQEYRFLWDGQDNEARGKRKKWMTRLDEAQDDECPFAHPFYWAPFIVFAR